MGNSGIVTEKQHSTIAIHILFGVWCGLHSIQICELWKPDWPLALGRRRLTLSIQVSWTNLALSKFSPTNLHAGYQHHKPPQEMSFFYFSWNALSKCTLVDVDEALSECTYERFYIHFTTPVVVLNENEGCKIWALHPNDVMNGSRREAILKASKWQALILRAFTVCLGRAQGRKVTCNMNGSMRHDRCMRLCLAFYFLFYPIFYSLCCKSKICKSERSHKSYQQKDWPEMATHQSWGQLHLPSDAIGYVSGILTRDVALVSCKLLTCEANQLNWEHMIIRETLFFPERERMTVPCTGVIIRPRRAARLSGGVPIGQADSGKFI